MSGRSAARRHVPDQPSLFDLEPPAILPAAPLFRTEYKSTGSVLPDADSLDHHCAGCHCVITPHQVWCAGCQNQIDAGDDPDTCDDAPEDRCDYCDAEVLVEELVDARLVFPGSWPGGAFLRVCPDCWAGRAEHEELLAA